MNIRARRTFPGVIVSLMLAAPALGANTSLDAVKEPRVSSRHVAVRKRPARPAGTVLQHVASEQAGYQSGLASWYGGAKWNGKVTASGARYDERSLTAAHATLPLGSQVKVVVNDTGHSVIVTINDRPGTRKRVIDLSRGAAEALGIVKRGVARVTLVPA